MRKGKFPTFRHGIWVMLFLLIGAANLWSAGQMGHEDKDQTVEKRADVITIDTLKRFGPLEREAVTFLHDKHTQVVEKQNKDCLTCHAENKGKLSAGFKQTEDLNKAQAMDVYHDNCIACHMENAAQGLESGPVTCGECHLEKSATISDRQPMGLDKSLHFRHLQAQEKKCELCHHEYDAKAKKLFYAKGQEGTCRYCHKAQTEENRISMRLASHLQCINCHREKMADKIHAGPIHCDGCHSLQAQQSIDKVTEIPRLERDQPDSILIRAAAEAPPSEIPAERVPPVAFNHKAHEGYNDTCRGCHHASMAACTTCHTRTGNKDGKEIRLAQAMHLRDSDISCIGCHAAKQISPECAGCHKTIDLKQNADPTDCKSCHVESSDAMRPSLTKQEARAAAAKIIASAPPMIGTYALEDIPEKVIIQKLSDQYQPVEMPHRKIVIKLADNIKENKIAGRFHRDPGSLCLGCHHNGPPSKNPPACGSCHGKPFDAATPSRPGLMGAYHQQCFECHFEMGIKKPDSRECTACHPLKERS